MRRERYFHECPECGLLTPYLQGRCDCGYRFQKFQPKRREIVVKPFLLIFLGISIGLNMFFVLALHTKSSRQLPAANTDVYTASTSTLQELLRPSQAPIDPTPSPVAVENGQIFQRPSQSEALAPFIVETVSGQNYYIYLQPKYGSDYDKQLGSMSFYVEGGKTVNVQVPLVTYDVYYATGDTWYGTALLFGDSTAYYKCESDFLFYYDYSRGEYMGWTIELYATPSGNLDMVSIDAVDFPEIH